MKLTLTNFGSVFFFALMAGVSVQAATINNSQNH